LSAVTLFVQFSKNRQAVIENYIEVVKYGVGKTVWDPLQHRISLGDEAFVARHQAMQYGLEGELFEILFKQRSAAPLLLSEWAGCAARGHLIIGFGIGKEQFKAF
jgi:putative transposase